MGEREEREEVERTLWNSSIVPQHQRGQFGVEEEGRELSHVGVVSGVESEEVGELSYFRRNDRNFVVSNIQMLQLAPQTVRGRKVGDLVQSGEESEEVGQFGEKVREESEFVS